jgi:hypothetical protein
MFTSVLRRLLRVFRPIRAGRNAIIEDVRRLKIHRSTDPDPAVQAARKRAMAEVDEYFAPIIEAARNLERITPKDLDVVVRRASL